ncbi:MAG: nucleotidyltransferase family protein [Lachnospiraceae bacterium]|nr:nucleotidyltransferase family protein [Lachnospiraceae bacterium]
MPVGIICEYDPLHKGHVYQMQEARRLAAEAGIEDNRIVAVMSGNYVQRGMPSLCDKFQRTRMALEAGVSLVLELPTYYSTATAEWFAFGGVSLLERSGLVRAISFGLGDPSSMDLLQRSADLLVPESPAFSALLRQKLNLGLPYAAARQQALEQQLGESLPTEPNGILALEYLKALKRLSSTMQVVFT